ncbi:MAG: DMT family transporter [Promethearchaeota archaeon]
MNGCIPKTKVTSIQKLKPITYIYLLTTVFLFGTLFVFSRKIIEPVGPLNSLNYLFMRFLLASIFMFVYVLARGKGKEITSNFKKNPRKIFLFTAGMHMPPLILVFIATPLTSADNQTIINNMNLSFVVMVNFLFFRNKPGRNLILAVLVNFLGGLLVMSPLSLNKNEKLAGDIIMLFAVFLSGFYPYFNKIMAHENDPMVLSFFMNFIPMLVLLPFMFIFNLWPAYEELDSLGWFFMLWIGIGVSGLAYGFGNAAYTSDKRLTPETYSIFSTLISIIGLITNFLVFHKIMGPLNLIGAGLVIFSILISAITGKNNKKQPVEDSSNGVVDGELVDEEKTRKSHKEVKYKKKPNELIE